MKVTTKKEMIEFIYHTLGLDMNQTPRPYIEKVYDHYVTAMELKKPVLMKAPDITGHMQAIKYVHENKNRVPSKADISLLHKMITSDPLQEPGRFREKAVMVGTKRAFPAKDLPIMLSYWCSLWNQKPKKNATKKQCALLRHYEFIHLHPFVESSKKVARLLLLWDCLHHKVSMDIIKVDEMFEYLDDIKNYSENLRAETLDSWKASS